MSNILESLFIFFSTNIDFLIFLVIIFSHIAKKESKYVYVGFYIGTFLIIFAGLLLSRFSSLLPAQWMIGFLGFIPLFIGLKMLFAKDSKQSIIDLENKLRDDVGVKLVLFVIGLTLITGGDNVGVFISFFTDLNISSVFAALIVFVIMSFVFLIVGEIIANHPVIENIIEKYEHYFIPFIFILLGIFILFDSGLINQFLNVLK